MEHVDWQEDLLAEGFESTGSNSLIWEGNELVFEVYSYQNFEECFVQLRVVFPQESLQSKNLEELQPKINGFFEKLIGDNSWEDRWNWLEDEDGFEIADLLDSSEDILNLVNRESELLNLIGIS